MIGKNLIIVAFFILILFFNCEMNQMPEWNEMLYGFSYNINVDNLYEALEWCASNITYKTDSEVWGLLDYWQSPEQTYLLRSGDCEDSSIFFMYLLKEELDKSSNFVIVQSVDGGNCHAVVEVGDKWYESTCGIEADKTQYKVKTKYGYDQAMYMATVFHNGSY